MYNDFDYKEVVRVSRIGLAVPEQPISENTK